MNKRGQVWVSTILYFTLTLVLIIFLLNYFRPTLDRIKTNSEMKALEKEAMKFNDILEELIKEGKGSQKEIDLALEKGSILVTNDSLKVVLPRVSDDLIEKEISDKVVITTKNEIFISENSTHYELKNAYIRIKLKKYGNSSNHVSINTSEILEEIEYLETNSIINPDFSFYIGDDESTSIGTGYTELIKSDFYNSFGKINIYMHTSKVNYMFSIVLESDMKFIRFLGPFFI